VKNAVGGRNGGDRDREREREGTKHELRRNMEGRGGEELKFSHSGGVESILGPLGTSPTEWPIVPAPGDCDDGEFGGMKIGRGNRSTRRKPAPAPLYPPQIPLARPGLQPGPPRWEAATSGGELR
jgi:hypothetical protein